MSVPPRVGDNLAEFFEVLSKRREIRLRDKLFIVGIPSGIAFLMSQDGNLQAVAASLQHPVWRLFMQGVTLSGDFSLLLLICGLFWAVGNREKTGRLRWIGERGVVTLVLSRIVVEMLKAAVGRGRPRATETADPFLFIGPTMQVDFHGFPSGHTASAFVVATLAAATFPQLRRYFMLWAVLVALSRLALNEHFASDVVVGGLLGYGAARLCLKNTGIPPAPHVQRTEQKGGTPTPQTF